MRKSLLLYLLWLTCHVGGAPTTVFAQSTKTVYKDHDGDGHGDPSKPKSTNNPSQGYVTLADDCNDKDASIYKGAKEIKDGKDNDCDGLIDELVWFQDKDGDGYGSSVTKEAVTKPAGYSDKKGDANDNDNTIYPGASEICDGKDNDQNGTVDDGGGQKTYYVDADKDGYGSPTAPPVMSCTDPSTSTVTYSTTNTDANDNDDTIYPGAEELCDEKDNDQDGIVDNHHPIGAIPYHRDADGDGYGDPYNEVDACSQPNGYVINSGDCDDTRPGDFTVYYYEDRDGDGYGAGTGLARCEGEQPAGWVANNNDANDDDATINPDAPELCDNKDNDQDGQVDENCPSSVARMDASAETDQLRRPASSLYPNPATSELTIAMSRPTDELKSVTVSTVIDQKVSFTDYVVLERGKVKITVTHLKPGVYIIRLDFGDGYEVLKFIKN